MMDSDNFKENPRYPVQPPGFGMMQGASQFIPPGIQLYSMMQQPMIMSQQQMMGPAGIQPVLSVGIRPTQMAAAPPYTQQLAENYQAKLRVPKARMKGNMTMSAEEERKQLERKQHQQRLKQEFTKAASGGLNADVLIESMFGKSDKPVPKEEDGFGDFMGGPNGAASESAQRSQSGSGHQSNIAMVTSSLTNDAPGNMTSASNGGVQQISQRSPSITPSQQEKKDLMAMMFEYSDLTAPSKAKVFQKTSLKEINPAYNHLTASHVHLDSQQARKWDYMGTENLSDLFIAEAQKDKKSVASQPSKPSPVTKHLSKPPPWLHDDSLIPQLYKQVLEASLVDGKINTDRLYPLLMLSGLQREMLGHIWGLANKETPGQLIKSELFTILALVALVQNNYKIVSTDILSRCPHPPIPVLNAMMASSGMMTQGMMTPGDTIQSSNGASQSAIPPGGTSQSAVLLSGAGQSTVPPGGTSQQVTLISGPSQVMMHTALLSQQMSTVVYPGILPSHPTTSSSPATLPVTQLPALAINQGAITKTTQNDNNDDFADFQAAPVPQNSKSNFGNFLNEIRSEKQLPVKDEGKYLYKVPKPDDEAIAISLSPEISQSTVRNFFCSDDSSEAAFVVPFSVSKHQKQIDVKGGGSLDDEYYDGYKSPDSKPSDSSTSQFSTSDLSESEDFRNFDSYLDEISKKEHELKKDESPLHRPISSKGKQPQATPTPPKVPALITLVPQLPPPSYHSSGGSNGSLENFADFTEFKSASGSSVAYSKVQEVTSRIAEDDSFSSIQQAQAIVTPGGKGVTQNCKEGNSAVSSSDLLLIGDEDKYAALRNLGFDDELTQVSLPATQGSSTFPSSQDQGQGAEDNWADFQGADFAQIHEGPEAKTSLSNIYIPATDITSKSSTSTGSESLNDRLVPTSSGETSVTDTSVSSSWAAFASPASKTAETGDWTGYAPSGIDIAENKTTQMGYPISHSTVSLTDQEEDDWADFQGSGVDRMLTGEDNSKQISLVQIRKENLNKDEVLSLFSVKHDPSPPSHLLKSESEQRQKIGNKEEKEEFCTFSTSSDISEFSNGNSDMHKQKPANAKNLHHELKEPEHSRITNIPMDLDLRGPDEDLYPEPPPLDDSPIEEDDHYSRGYDFDDFMQPKPLEKKSHVNPHIFYNKKPSHVPAEKKTDDKKSQLYLDTKRSPVDLDDSDSLSSKDMDVSKDRSGTQGDDSQSVASLEFATGKRIQELKDTEGTDSQSISSNEFGNFETSTLPHSHSESKSLDSLDLCTSDPSTDTANSSNNSEQEDKEVSFMSEIQDNQSNGIMFPVLGDRYSGLLQDVPGSDKHLYEWQRCLESCYLMIRDANNMFNSISSSAVCNEIMRSSQGSDYVQGIIEIYRIVCRIALSMKTAALSNDKLQQLLKDINLAWNNLTAFLAGGSVMPDPHSLDFSSAVLLSDDISSQYKACGICVLNVGIRPHGKDREEENTCLTYGGRQYHATCANFWINCVEPLLPALKLPELL